MWLDNYAQLRYVVDPLVGMHMLSCTAMAVMRVEGGVVPEAVVLPTLRGLLEAIPRVADDLERYGVVMRALCAEVVRSGPPQGRVRIPLDVVRDRPLRVRWRPFALVDVQVGS